MENNKVAVKIYGQEYTISGQKSREYIIKVANHVDENMREIAKQLKSASVASLAVLAAVNITDECFSKKEELVKEKRITERLTSDTNHYLQLWEEAKSNFIQYKNDATKATEENIALKSIVKEKDEEIRKLNESIENAIKGANEEEKAHIEALEDKCKDMENCFFELQMENIQLKGEIDRLKRLNGDF